MTASCRASFACSSANFAASIRARSSRSRRSASRAAWNADEPEPEPKTETDSSCSDAMMARRSSSSASSTRRLFGAASDTDEFEFDVGTVLLPNAPLDSFGGDALGLVRKIESSSSSW
jgi:hypothetical protein